MSEAFDRFLREYNSTGRQKADGYTLSTLALLSLEEKLKAIELLQSEVMKDTWGIDALATINSEAAIKTLEEVVKKREENELKKSFEVFFWLWKLTKKEIYAENFCNCRAYISDSKLSPFYVYAKDSVESKVVEKFLRQSIFTEKDPTAVSIAAGALLEKYGISYENEITKSSHCKMWTILTEGDSDRKKEVLDSLM